MSFWSRFANVFRTGRLERELDEELQFHIDARIRELTAAGMTREAAAAEVARRFGNPLRLREESRDVKLLPWLDSLVRDVRLGAGMLAMRPARFADSGDEKEQVRTQFVSGDAFDRLGVMPAAGRVFTVEDDGQPGAHPVAIVSHAFWVRRFGGDPTIVGGWFALED